MLETEGERDFLRLGWEESSPGFLLPGFLQCALQEGMGPGDLGSQQSLVSPDTQEPPPLNGL